MGGYQVAEEEAVEEDALGAQDHSPHIETGAIVLEEGEKVHTFVQSFFQERLNLLAVSAAT